MLRIRVQKINKINGRWTLKKNHFCKIKQRPVNNSLKWYPNKKTMKQVKEHLKHNSKECKDRPILAKTRKYKLLKQLQLNSYRSKTVIRRTRSQPKSLVTNNSAWTMALILINLRTGASSPIFTMMISVIILPLHPLKKANNYTESETTTKLKSSSQTESFKDRKVIRQTLRFAPEKHCKMAT